MTTEAPGLTQTQIDAVNAYADYLVGDYITRDHRQIPARNREISALRSAALTVLDVVQNWPEVARTDGQHLTLQAPDGTLVLYICEDGAERLRLLDEEPPQPPPQRSTTMAEPFTPDNCEGYTQAAMDTLNTEFTRRWNGWDVTDDTLFFYANGVHMSEEDAIKQFQHEVAQR